MGGGTPRRKLPQACGSASASSIGVTERGRIGSAAVPAAAGQRPALPAACVLRFARLLFVLGLYLALAAPIAGAQGLDEEARGIARELQCPVCQGLSVADSPSELASQMRSVIREKLHAGESRQAIMGYFVDRYGETILLTPPRSGFTAVVWVAPYLALLAGVAILVWAARRRFRAPAEEPPPDPGLAAYLEAVDRTFDRLRDQEIR